MAEDYISLIGEDGLKELDLAKKSAKELADIVVDTNSKIADMYSKLKSNKSFAEFNKIAGDAQSLLSGLRSGLSSYEQAALKAAVAEKQLAAASRLRAQAQGTANAQARVAAEGFKDLKQSVRDIAGELPSLSGGISNFFKAIAGKIPGLIEQMVKAKEMNEALAASGKRGIPVWKQMAAGIFSWQTALVTGIALAIDWFDRQTTVTEKADKAMQVYIDNQKELTESIGGEVSALTVLYNTATNISLSYRERGKAVDELQSRFPEYFANVEREKILNGEAQGSYENLTEAIIKQAKVKAKQNLLNKAIAEQASAQLQLDRAKEGSLWLDNEQTNRLKNIILFRQKEIDLLTKQIRIQQEADTFSFGYIDDETRKKAEADEKKQKALALMSPGDRSRKETPAPGKPVTTNTDASAQASSKKDQLSMIKELNDELQKENDAFSKKEVEADMKNQEAIMDNEQASLDERMAARWQYHNGLIALAEMEKAQADKDNEDKHRYLLADIAGIQDKSEREKLATAENERYKKQYYSNIDELAAKSNQAIADYAAQSAGDIEKTDQEALKQKDANLKSLVDAYATAGSSVSETWQQHLDKVNEKLNVLKSSLQVFEQIGQLMKAINERNIQAIDKEAEENEKKEQKEIDAIKATVTNKDEAAQKIAEVEKRGQQQHELLEARKKKMQQDQARFEKAVSIVSIIAKTAEAVVAGLKVSPILAAAYGALGALELATVIATPVPQYAEGTADHPGGPAIVGDGGEPELVVSGKTAYWSPAVATLVNLVKHAQVIPMHDMINASAGMVTARELADRTWLNGIGPGYAGEICTSVDDMKYAVVNSLEKLNRKVPLKMIGNGFDSYIHKNL